MVQGQILGLSTAVKHRIIMPSPVPSLSAYALSVIGRQQISSRTGASHMKKNGHVRWTETQDMAILVRVEHLD